MRRVVIDQSRISVSWPQPIVVYRCDTRSSGPSTKTEGRCILSMIQSLIHAQKILVTQVKEWMKTSEHTEGGRRAQSEGHSYNAGLLHLLAFRYQESRVCTVLISSFLQGGDPRMVAQLLFGYYKSRPLLLELQLRPSTCWSSLKRTLTVRTRAKTSTTGTHGCNTRAKAVSTPFRETILHPASRAA